MSIIGVTRIPLWVEEDDEVEEVDEDVVPVSEVVGELSCEFVGELSGEFFGELS